MTTLNRKVLGKPPEIAPRAFVSRLSQRLLSHGNGGALAVVGHVDRTWTTSFEGSEKGEGVDVFRNTLRRLLAGHTVGWAMEYFNQAHAALAAELSNLWGVDRIPWKRWIRSGSPISAWPITTPAISSSSAIRR